MTDTSSTADGLIFHATFKAQVEDQWDAIRPTISSAVSLNEPDVADPPSRITCYISALLDFLRALALCQGISSDADRWACMQTAQSNYNAAIASCDAQ
jgi:hypothetical protein